MKKSIALGAVLAALMAIPSFAAPICSGTFGLPDDIYSEREINDFNFEMLRGNGVDVIRTEIWGGCIRAFVIGPDGTEEMQFFEPTNFRRVE